MKIDLAVLDRQFKLHQVEYEAAALRVLRSGRYILGPEVEQFEDQYKKYMGAKYCVGLNSGLDALVLAVRSLDIGPGDEVIVPANTYIATVLAITENGAKPVFVEPDIYYNIDPEKIEKSITENTKAIIAVHLYGQAANMMKIKEIANKHNLYLLEDCAQSHGARYAGIMTGTFGDIGCFSFFPTKNLGAFGDAGAIITNNENIYNKIKMLRNYGSQVKYQNEITGVNSRLDELQAALLCVKLQYIENLNCERKKIAGRYLKEISNPLIEMPQICKNAEHVYHQFVVRTKKRDALRAYLEEKGIQTIIHYPIPPHLAVCYKYLNLGKGSFPIAEEASEEVLSLPIFNGMLTAEINYVIQTINEYEK